jgi:hypothetical protein
LKDVREKNPTTFKGKPINITAKFFMEDIKPRRA